MPYPSSAWQNFLANGYSKKLSGNQYEMIKDAYETIEGTNFIRQLSSIMLASTSSPLISNDTKVAIYQGVQTNHLQPILFALPKIRRAIPEVKEMIDESLLSSILRYRKQTS